MRRLVLILLTAAGIAAAAWAPVSRPEPPPLEFRTVTSAVLVCPRTTGAGQAANVLGALTAGPITEQGSAVLRRSGPGDDLVLLPEADGPVVLNLAGPAQTPIVLQAAGSWAPSSFAGITSRALTGVEQGLASASCPAPGPQWWFVGAGSQIGRGAALLVTNAADEPARFDINLYSSAGPVQALAGKGIDLGPAASVRLRVDALAPDQDLLAINVRTTSGRVAAALRDVAITRDGQPRGVDYLPPAQAPDTRLVVAGIPGGAGRRDLVLVNPGTQFATVTPRLLTEDGPIALPDLATIAVPAGAVIQVDLARVLEGAEGSLDLTSDVPISGGARVEVGAAARDLTWLSAVPLIGGPNPLGGAGATPSGPGLSTTVVIAAPAGQVSGTLTTVTTLADEFGVLSGRPSAQEAGPSAQETDPSAQEIEVVLPEGEVDTVSEQVTVASGSQRTITVSSADGGGTGSPAAGVLTLTWRSDPDSAPAAVSHLVLDPDLPLLSGYPWWPVTSSVPAVPVRENLGVLAGGG